MLFIRGNATSGAPSIKGSNQFPNSPIRIGITIKKIITKAWTVTMTLHIWSSEIEDPGCRNSFRISILRNVPTIHDQAPNTKCSVSLSL